MENLKITKNKSLNHNYFDNLDCEKYWLLGLFASDGSVNKGDQVITISQSGDSGFSLISYIHNLLECKNPIRTAKTGKKDAHYIYISSSNILKVFLDFGIVPSKSKIGYKMPKIENIEHFRDFIRGYVEGDGSITVQDNGKGIMYLSFQLIADIDFVNDLIERLPEFKFNVRKYKNKNYVTIALNGEKAILFCDWLFQNDSLYKTYKYQNYLKAKDLFTKTDRYKYRRIRENTLRDYYSNPSAGSEFVESLGLKYGVASSTIYDWIKDDKNEKK